MTFTYTPATPTDITRVRWHIQDTDADAPIFTDEEITFLIAEEGTWQKAVIGAIRGIIAKIGVEGDFQADWLRVDRTKALAAYKLLLAEKQRELNVTSITASGKPVYRGDSNADGPPAW